MARLNEELALLSANQPVKQYRNEWRVARNESRPEDWTFGASYVFFITTLSWLNWGIAFIINSLNPFVVRGLMIPSILSVVWFGCFCKLVRVSDESSPNR